MDYAKLGASGLEVSRLCLGCMSFGDPARGTHPWTLDEERSRSIIERALQAGINFFDTANVYSLGTSEEILGRALRDMARRDEVVIATKVYGRMRPGPNGAGLSRKAIMSEVEASLRRLGVDYIDLYQVHRLDRSLPAEEWLRTLDDLVRSGKVRYIGASSMYAWEFARLLYLQQANGWARFVSMQDHYNLLYREIEREMLPLCRHEGVGALVWSPLARGKLTRPWKERTRRSESDEFGRDLYDDGAGNAAIVEEVHRLAGEHGRSPAQIALAFVAHQAGITAPIVGATDERHLAEAVGALEVSLSESEVERLRSLYQPKAFLAP